MKISSMILFPHNPHSSKLDRFIKVILLVGVLTFFILIYENIIVPAQQRQPYYAFSFQNNYDTFPEKEIYCNLKPLCMNPDQIVISYDTYADNTAEKNYVSQAMIQNVDNQQILNHLENDGAINVAQLKAKDINDYQDYVNQAITRTILYTIIAYFFATQILYRIFLYIVYGKTKQV